ncbi:MAG: lipoprotein signal peptidase [Chitinophagales bacterium]|nr:lipoprotein signal peptidase [Chitinophagales bacterium]MDW8427197.1 lipoprotein signal peptidase [Chitinophagales bacterium]
MNRLRLALLVVALVLLADQIIKFWVKLTFFYGESRRITDWFYLYFIENEGMAFGLTLGGHTGKLALTLFRLLAVAVLSWYLLRLIRRKAAQGLVVSLSLILAGALGNIVDSVFYGRIFSESTADRLAVLFPEGGGYAPLLHGRVVDYLYFPLFEGFLPQWVPIWGGDYFIFFRPIFNIADASITTGVLLIVLFQRRFFPPEKAAGAAQPTRQTAQ